MSHMEQLRRTIVQYAGDMTVEPEMTLLERACSAIVFLDGQLAAARREVETVRATLTMERDSDREALRMVKREIEAVQSEVRLRGETIDALRREVAGWEERTKKLGSVVLRAWEVLRGWWQFSKLEERDEPFVDALTRAIAADAEHDAYALGEIRRLRDESGASRAALEDVRRVEAFAKHPDNFLTWHADGSISAKRQDRDGHYVRVVDVARADSLAALGRALAQEAGDAAR